MLIGKIRIIALNLCLCALAILAGCPAHAAESRFIQDRFGTGLWVDPPLDKQMDAHYAALAEANFTFIIGNFGASTPESVSQQLALCQKYDLKAIVSMAGQSPDKLPTNSACWGYFLADEPSPDSFPGLRKTVDALRQARPGKWFFI